MSVQEMLIMVAKLLLAGLLGGIVGYEREIHDHPAGLRTHILVCLGSALMTLVSVYFRPPVGDPSRIAAQIVSGIGFLGAGTILRQGSIVRGLTTAASLWTVAGIGMAVGIGGPDGVFIILGSVATLVVFVTLSILRAFEPGAGRGRQIVVEMSGDPAPVLGHVMQELIGLGVDVQTVQTADARAAGYHAFRLRLTLPRKLTPDAVVKMLAGQSGLERFDWS